jgi:hypothetical protein
MSEIRTLAGISRPLTAPEPPISLDRVIAMPLGYAEEGLTGDAARAGSISSRAWW